MTVRQGVPVPEAGLVKHGELRSQNSHARRVDGSMVVRSTYAPAWARQFIDTSHATLSGHSLQRIGESESAATTRDQNQGAVDA